MWIIRHVHLCEQDMNVDEDVMQSHSAFVNAQVLVQLQLAQVLIARNVQCIVGLLIRLWILVLLLAADLGQIAKKGETVRLLQVGDAHVIVYLLKRLLIH